MRNHNKNESLKRGYKKVLESAFIFSILTLITIFFSFQNYKSKYIMPAITCNEIIAINLSPQTIQLKRPLRPRIPSHPVARDEDEFLDAVTFDLQNYKFQDMEIVPPPYDDEEFLIHELDKKPELIKRIIPVYPRLAIKTGHTGNVVLKVLIGKDGAVERVEILKDDLLLREAAIEAAWKYKFTPGRQGVRNVKVWMSIPFHFHLK